MAPALLPLAGTLLAVVAGSLPAESYRFESLRGGESIAIAADALRWDAAEFPLRFHLQDNIPEYLAEDEWRGVVSDSLAMWSGVRTADIQLALAPGLVAGDGADGRDDRLTIGWISPEDEAATFSGRAVMWFGTRTGRVTHCDIEMNRDRFRKWLDEDVDRSWVMSSVRRTVLHEVGHCLGLLHTEPHPIPPGILGWTTPPPVSAGFVPQTVMSYAYGRDFQLTEDERVGVSLLYPAAGFPASRGVVAGRLVREGGTVPFAYVQAVYPGSDPRMGPGAFSDSDGYFHLEGLDPGPVLLWIHPILIHYSNPHRSLLALASEGGGLDVVDQWHWVRGTRGEIVSVPDIELAAGRLP